MRIVDPLCPCGDTGDNDQHMSCSVIIPVYNERDNTRAMHQALAAVAETERSLDWEFLFVEDDHGVPQRVPKSYQVPYGITWYNLAETRDRLGIAFHWAITA